MPSRKNPTPAATAAAPAPAPAKDTTTQGAAPPPADPPPPPMPTTEPICVGIADLGRARLLPEAPEGHAERPDDVQFEPGTIEQFMDADGRTMRIVNVGGQAHKAPAPPIPDQPTTEEA